MPWCGVSTLCFSLVLRCSAVVWCYSVAFQCFVFCVFVFIVAFQCGVPVFLFKCSVLCDVLVLLYGVSLQNTVMFRCGVSLWCTSSESSHRALAFDQRRRDILEQVSTALLQDTKTTHQKQHTKTTHNNTTLGTTSPSHTTISDKTMHQATEQHQYQHQHHRFK